MEQLIKELNDPANQSSSNRIQHIQRQLQQLQRQKSGWQAGFELLGNEQQVVRFYGALTLTIKINADWENDGLSDDEAARDALLEGLINSYVQLTNVPDAALVLLKICSTLTAYFLQQSANWKLPMRHLLASMLHGRYLSPAEIPGQSALLDEVRLINFCQLRGVLWFASTLVEDATRLEISSFTSAVLVERLCQSSSDVWPLLYLCLQSFLTMVHPRPSRYLVLDVPLSLVEGELLEIIRTVLSMLIPWLHFMPVKPETGSLDSVITSSETFVERCIPGIFECFSCGTLADLTIQTLTTLAQSHSGRFRKVPIDHITNITSSAQATSWINELQHGQHSPEAVRYVEFLVALVNLEDLSSSEYILQEHISNVLQTLQKLLGRDGAAAVEDEVSQLILECISEVVESYSDWEGDSLANDIMKPFIRDLCTAAIKKAQFPAEEMDENASTWDADDRMKFLEFRNDVLDFFYAAFLSLGDSLVEALAIDIVRNDFQDEWPVFEARLFCLDGFSDTLENDPHHFDPIIHTVMNTRKWAIATDCTKKCPARARQACIRFISHTTGYLSRKPSVLVSCLEFLFSLLQVADFSSMVSRAIQTLCFEQRSVLIEALPQFLNALSTLSNLEAAERHRIYSSVAAIVQVIPTEEDKLSPLMQILDRLSDTFATTRQNASSTQEEAKSWSVDLLQTLAAVGKGLRTAADVAIDVEFSGRLQANFWTSGEGRSLQQRALAICISALNASELHSDGEIVEAACDFIKSGYTEEDPSPFKFAPGISVDFLTSQIALQNSKIDAVMSCASAFLSSAKLDSLGPLLDTLLAPIFANYQVLMTEKDVSGTFSETDFPSSSLEFLTRLLPKWGSQWLRSQVAQESLALTVEVALVVLSAPDTLPRRSAASFFATVFDLTGPTANLGDVALGNLSQTLRTYSPRFIGLLLRLLAGECSRSEIESLTEPLKKVILRQNPTSRKALKGAMTDNAGFLSAKALEAVSMDERLRFVAQIEGLRGARKTNDVVRDFWLKCRGGAFGYVT